MFSCIIVDYKSMVKTIMYINHLIEKIKMIDTFIVINNDPESNFMESELKEFANVNEGKFEGYPYRHYINNEINIFIVLTKENLGYARGNNVGIRMSKLMINADYGIISNNDLVVQNETFDLNLYLDIFRNNPDIAAIGPKIVGLDGRKQSPCRFVSLKDRWTLKLMFYPLNPPKPREEEVINIASGRVYRVQGSFIAFDVNKMIEIGCFDENTFLFSEEAILSERMKKYGYSFYYDEQLSLLHDHGQTIAKHHSALERTKLRYKSDTYYYLNYINEKPWKIRLNNMNFRIFTLKFRLIHFLLRKK